MVINILEDSTAKKAKNFCEPYLGEMGATAPKSQIKQKQLVSPIERRSGYSPPKLFLQEVFRDFMK